MCSYLLSFAFIFWPLLRYLEQTHKKRRQKASPKSLNMRSKSLKISSKVVLETGLDSSAKNVRFWTPSDPLGRVLASTSAQFSLFPSAPKSLQNGGPKLLKWRPNALKNLSGEGLKKVFKQLVIFSPLWDTLK